MTHRMPRLPLAALVVATVSACAEPAVHPDPRATHPLTVRQEAVRLTLKAPLSPESLSVEDRMRLVRFVDHFTAKGTGNVRIETLGTGGGYEGGAWMDGARRMLMEAGLPANRIQIAEGGGAEADSQPFVLLSFTGNAVDVPNCARAVHGNAFNPNNLPSADWGCSVQRNFGLMVQNPGDLLQARPVSERDPARTVTTIGDYRTGAVSGSSKSAEQQSGFSGSEAAGRAGAGGGTNSTAVVKGTDQATPVPAPAPAPTAAPAAAGGN